MSHKYNRVLTIAGSDPSGGAGVQADIKTISALGCFATSAIVAIVDENTQGVYGIHPVPVEFVTGQIRSVLDDIGTDVIKIGMLHSSELIKAVRNTLDSYANIRNIVLDPVMVATSGDSLLKSNAVESLISDLIPRTRVITPNIPEAEVILGEKISQKDSLPDAAQALSRKCHNVSVLLKAGHLSEDHLVDVFYNAEESSIHLLPSPRINTKNTHGTGCTLSSALASFLAKGHDLNSAVYESKKYISEAIMNGAKYQIGKGNGPVCHFYNLWEE